MLQTYILRWITHFWTWISCLSFSKILTLLLEEWLQTLWNRIGGRTNRHSSWESETQSCIWTFWVDTIREVKLCDIVPRNAHGVFPCHVDQLTDIIGNVTFLWQIRVMKDRILELESHLGHPPWAIGSGCCRRIFMLSASRVFPSLDNFDYFIFGLGNMACCILFYLFFACSFLSCGFHSNSYNFASLCEFRRRIARIYCCFVHI